MKDQKNHKNNQCDFQGEHFKLLQDCVQVLVQVPPIPSQHLQTTPSVAKIFEYPWFEIKESVLASISDGLLETETSMMISNIKT